MMLMQQQGLTVTKASGPEWRQEGEVLAATMRGEMVPQGHLRSRPQRARRVQKAEDAAGPGPVIRALATLEDVIAGLALAVMVVLPLLEIVVRHTLGVGVPASGPIVQHLTLWVGFLGAAIAAREGKLLSLATGTLVPDGPAAPGGGDLCGSARRGGGGRAGGRGGRARAIGARGRLVARRRHPDLGRAARASGRLRA